MLDVCFSCIQHLQSSSTAILIAYLRTLLIRSESFPFAPIALLAHPTHFHCNCNSLSIMFLHAIMLLEELEMTGIRGFDSLLFYPSITFACTLLPTLETVCMRQYDSYWMQFVALSSSTSSSYIAIYVPINQPSDFLPINQSNARSACLTLMHAAKSTFPYLAVS